LVFSKFVVDKIRDAPHLGKRVAPTKKCGRETTYQWLKEFALFLWSLTARRNDLRASNVYSGISTISQHHLWPHCFGGSLHHPSARRSEGRNDECVGNQVQEFRRTHMFS
jgi:hypothetical protein